MKYVVIEKKVRYVGYTIDANSPEQALERWGAMPCNAPPDHHFRGAAKSQVMCVAALENAQEKVEKLQGMDESVDRILEEAKHVR